MVERKEFGPKGGGKAPRAGKTFGRQGSANQRTYPAYENPRDQEPVDADVSGDYAEKARRFWEQTRDQAREYFSQRTREQTRDRAREHFSQRTRAKTEEGERIRDHERAQAEAEDDPQMSERDQLLKLRAQTRQAGEKYMTSLRESNILAPGFNDKTSEETAEQERNEKFSAMHHVYTQMMVQSCMRPLARGVNSQSVIQAVGMMTAMTVLSKNFRDQVDETAIAPLKEKMQARIDNKTRAKGAQVGPEAEGRRGLSKKWQRRLDDLERRDRGNRDMFTPESAAMTEIGLMENAFWKLREPGVDPDVVKSSYKSLLNHVRGQFDDDGLDRNDVVARMKMMVGSRMEHEPELASMFAGVSHGLLERDQVVDDKTGQQRWGGGFVSCTGAKVPADGMFSLRQPMQPDHHRQAMTETMQRTLNDSVTHRDGEKLRDNIFGYMVAFSARRRGLDTSSSPSAQRAETMLASMELDGLDESQQRDAYSMAYVNALENMGAQHPDFDQTLNRTLGADWRERLQEAVDNPSQFMAEQATRPRAREAGAAPGPEPTHDQPESDYQPA